MISDIKIMIIDDNLPYRMLISAFIKKAGYGVIPARDGVEALDLLGDATPAVLLLDLQMQPMGGFEFMEEYNRLGYTMPVILITAQMESDILTRATKLGCAGVLQKPVDEQRIVATVRRMASPILSNL